MMRRYLLMFLCLMLWSENPVFSQDRTYRYALSLDFSVPSVLTGSVFNKVFDGIADLNAGLKIQTKRGFYTGPGFGFSFLKAGNNRNVSSSLFHTKYYLISPRWSVGYVYGQGTGTQISMGLEGGFSKAFFSETPCASPPVSPPPFLHIEPSVSLRFFSGENASFGARLGYNFIWNKFRPEQACLEKFVLYEPNQIRRISQYLVFGLGFSVYFKAIKQRPEQSN